MHRHSFKICFLGLLLLLLTTVSIALAESWICPKCGQENSGFFCSKCATARPQGNTQATQELPTLSPSTLTIGSVEWVRNFQVAQDAFLLRFDWSEAGLREDGYYVVCYSTPKDPTPTISSYRANEKTNCNMLAIPGEPYQTAVCWCPSLDDKPTTVPSMDDPQFSGFIKEVTTTPAASPVYPADMTTFEVGLKTDGSVTPTTSFRSEEIQNGASIYYNYQFDAHDTQAGKAWLVIVMTTPEGWKFPTWDSVNVPGGSQSFHGTESLGGLFKYDYASCDGATFSGEYQLDAYLQGYYVGTTSFILGESLMPENEVLPQDTTQSSTDQPSFEDTFNDAYQSLNCFERIRTDLEALLGTMDLYGTTNNGYSNNACIPLFDLTNNTVTLVGIAPDGNWYNAFWLKLTEEQVILASSEIARGFQKYSEGLRENSLLMIAVKLGEDEMYILDTPDLAAQYAALFN